MSERMVWRRIVPISARPVVASAEFCTTTEIPTIYVSKVEFARELSGVRYRGPMLDIIS